LARVHPLRGVHYDPGQVHLGGVLAPPYDVISPGRRQALYGRDLRNIVRVDFGEPYADDVPGESDVYSRGAEHLRSWLQLGVLVRDDRPSFYVTAHEFLSAEGSSQRRLGILARVPARPWEESEVKPHERTMRGPKEDRLALTRTTRMQTSPVWVMWDRAPELAACLDKATRGPALIGGRIDGEVGSEKLLLWRLDDDTAVAELSRLLEPAGLYVADGHHRFETAAAYAAERLAAGDPEDADSQFALIYACAADDPGLVLLPTHRLLTPRPGLPYSRDDLDYRLEDVWEMEAVDDPVAGLVEVGARRHSHHAFVVVSHEGAAILQRPRNQVTSPRQGLDVVVLQEEVIARCGIGEAELREGALTYDRDAASTVAAVRDKRAGLALLTTACTTAEVIAVADAGEVMPQKSTYFSPKVPTGLVLSPLG
jgi:uncharacterized protein (DUF1015 family)